MSAERKSRPGILAGVKEFFRKQIVTLKRNPSMIPLLMLVASFLVYSLNLTDMSDTTAKIQGAGMGLCQFCIMLFSLLSMLCMLNAFPRRKKVNLPMLIAMLVMFTVMIYCCFHYRIAITNALYRPESPIPMTDYIVGAYNMLNTFMIMLFVTTGLVALLPVYSRLLKKINTSVNVEDNGDMEAIEISE